MTVRHRSKQRNEPEPPAFTVADLFRQRLRDNPPSEHPVFGGGRPTNAVRDGI